MPQFNPLQMLAQPNPRAPRRPSANDPAELYALEGGFGDEAELRSIMAEMAGDAPNEVSALNRLAGSWRGKQADTMAGMMPTPFMNEQTSAINEGFGGSDLNPNPVIARNLYKRNIEQERLRQPIEQERMKQAGETQRQRMVSDADRYKTDRSYDESVDTETIRQEPQNTYAETNRMLQLNPDGSPRQGGNLASVGKGTVRYQTPQNPTTANNQLAIIRGNLVNRGGAPFINRQNNTREQAEYNSYITSIISGANIPAEAKQDIVSLMERPESAEMSIDELIQSLPIDQTQLDAADIQALTDIFLKLKG